MIHSLRETISNTVRGLTPQVMKEGVKNVVGGVTCVFGLAEVVDVCYDLKTRKIFSEPRTDRDWVKTAQKTATIFGRISLLLSAMVSRPVLWLISTAAKHCSRPLQMPIFAVNPWHPRHVMSIAAVILALPSLIDSAVIALDWAYKKVKHYKDEVVPNATDPSLLSDNKVRLMVVFNTLTSRPVLHLGYQLCHFFGVNFSP